MSDPLEQEADLTARWLVVTGAPPLSGASAAAIVELLWAMADTIDGEYAAEIIAHRQRGRPHRSPWSPATINETQQLSLDLEDEGYF